MSLSAKVYLFVLLAFVLGYALGRRQQRPSKQQGASFQNQGESQVTRAIRAEFAAPDHHLLNHITLRLPDGTTQIDHILISRFGVLVIETKDYKGWIFADSQRPTWTQVFPNGKFQFQNPIFQNMRHLQAVRSLLDFLPPETITSAVVFTGDAEFKTDMPAGVFTLSGLLAHLRSFTEERLSMNRVQFCVGRLETARLALSGQTDLEHIDSLQKRFGHSA